MQYDVVIVGAGIVGLATAYQLKRANPNLRVIVIEKEDDIAQHQTGHNSGVIHSGIYYKPGSLKALNCKKGYDDLIRFAKEQGIKYDLCGKVIVATKESERQSLNNIYERGQQNNLGGLRRISAAEVKEIEPHVKCIEGIWVPQTGIIDYTDVSRTYLRLFQELGGEVQLNTKVVGIQNRGGSQVVETTKQEYSTKILVNCAGLYSDKVGRLSQPEIKNIKIIPFRGEYYELKPHKEYLVKNLIYPVPNPDFPFLGVHFTRMIHGGVEAGPNAVLAFRREGYTRWQINVGELLETLAFPGFQKVARQYWDEGFMEMKRSFSKRLFIKAMQELIPEVTADDVVPAEAGVRAQACDTDGKLIDDFLIKESKQAINVYNAPSPAATSSLAIGETITNLIIKKLS